MNELTPILSPLENIKNKVTVITNLELQQSYPGTHDTSNSGFLSSAFAKHTESSDYQLGTTVDQIAAKQIGQESRLASLELSMDINPLAGVCNNGYACVYQNNFILVFAHDSFTFGSSSAISVRAFIWRRWHNRRTCCFTRSRASLLDSFNEDISKLKRKVGASDQNRVDQYLETIREIERQIQRAEESDTEEFVTNMERPVGVPTEFGDHARLLYDLQVLALQADKTQSNQFPVYSRIEQPHLSANRCA
ncbi:MAG: hypothetical protein CM1200mP40_17480 [Gammaproteobacteria bacterium]|nr:MAG: hypothetical protein CM1200mP40_17480 [Gammaproteobacteria bacterium]